MDLEKNVFYLSANRLGFSEMETISPKYKVGIAGEYLFGTFEQEKSNPIEKELLILSESETLSSHINHWLTYILGIKFEMQTEKISQTKVKVVYKSDDLANLSPQQLGVGVSYWVKTLIMCLRAKKGDLLMIENPELHLHPAAQARLGEFFTYIANAGIQVLLETHCEHLINKLQYQHICCVGVLCQAPCNAGRYVCKAIRDIPKGVSYQWGNAYGSHSTWHLITDGTDYLVAGYGEKWIYQNSTEYPVVYIPVKMFYQPFV